MEKTLVVWRRLGKEHGEESGFRVNPKDIIDKHIKEKISLFNNTPDKSWRWWQVDESLIVEASENSRTLYYLPRKNWLIIKDFQPNRSNSGWKWYIHVGKTEYSEEYNCWIFTDWFADVIVKDDNITHSVLDLDELGIALKMGLIDSKQITEILSSAQELLDIIRAGSFPPQELKKRELSQMLSHML